MFGGISANSELYLKGNDDIIPTYKQYDSEQFCYINHKSNKEIRMNLWKVVDEILEDDALLKLCYTSALKSANEANNKKKSKKNLNPNHL